MCHAGGFDKGLTVIGGKSWSVVHKTEGSADIDVGNIHVPMLVIRQPFISGYP
jgi:hypothetical protein